MVLCVTITPILFIDPWGLEIVPLRSTIEGLGGTVIWNDQAQFAVVMLDGQHVIVYDGDKNGSYIVNGRLYTDDKWLFIALGTVIDIGQGWTLRFERHGSGTGYQKHVHVIYKDADYWSQNDDGSPHDQDKNKPGDPPNWIKKEMKSRKNWDWDAKRKDWINKIEIYNYGTRYYIIYPNGREVEVRNFQIGYIPVFAYPSNNDLIKYYTGPTYIDLNQNSSLGSIVIAPFSGSTAIVPVPAPIGIPVPIF